MQFAKLFALLAVAASASPATGLVVEERETNGQRMARGLHPLPPRDLRSSPVAVAKRGGPSSTPDPRCPSGTTYCCDYVKEHDDSLIGLILGLLGLGWLDGEGIGKGCDKSPVGDTCHQTLACCTGGKYVTLLGNIVTYCDAL